MSSVMEKTIISNGDHKKEPLSSLLPHLQLTTHLPVCPPSDQVYLQAAAIFQHLRTEKPVTHQRLHYGKKTDTPLPECGDRPTRKQAYQLAFNTLKYQDLLEAIIIDSCFHTSQQISEDLLPLAMVMLSEFQETKFFFHEQSKNEGQEVFQEVRDLKRSLHRCKTKLAASLARYRVKQSLQSVSCFLSDAVRTKQHRAKCLPLYAWINTLTISFDEMCEMLHSAGLHEAADMTDLKESTFCRDPLCSDTLVFPRSLHALLEHSSLTATHLLNIQDRSVGIAVSVLNPLLFKKGDVLMAGSFSAMTVAHVAVVAAAHSVRVLLCGPNHTPSQVEEIQEKLRQMDIGNVRILSEAFLSLDEWGAAVQRLKVIIVLPQCSSSALNNPIPTIHSEHGDWALLPDLSCGAVSKSRIHSLTAQQVRLLGRALTFPKVQTVVYCTRSVYPEENEQLVKRVLEKTHTHPKLLPFRVNGPIFPSDSLSGDDTESMFFRLKPSQFTNGCFIARLSRQVDPTKVETVQEVLARAAAKGLLGGIMPEQSITSKKGKNKKNRKTSRPSSPSSHERQTEEDPVTASEDEDEKGEGDFKNGEEGNKEINENEDKTVENRKKKKGRKTTVKKHQKQSKKTIVVSTDQSKSRKKKLTKEKANQSCQKRSRTKVRRIPRLTLTLMSSDKPSNHLSPITALAHRLMVLPEIQSQQTVLHTPPAAGKHHTPAPPTASKRPNMQPERAVKILKDKRETKTVGAESVVVTQQASKAADFILPPVSSPHRSSLHSRRGSDASQNSSSHLANLSASSSLVFMPGL
ncbi:putative methyltransferase NSUN7 [Pholidichthys leucotaenia]